MDGDPSRARIDAARALEQSPGATLVYRVAARGDAMSVAKWRIDNACVATGSLAQDILAIRTAGGAAVTRRTARESVRKHPSIGDVTYVSGDTIARWTCEGSSEALHVYIPTTRLRRFAEEELDRPTAPRIKEIFAVAEPWLQGYFQMLASEIEIFAQAERTVDPLFLAQTEHLLLRHLVGWHAEPAPPLQASAPERRPRSNPLPPTLMRRIRGYVDAHLGDDVALRDLADVACMSVGHFLRGFRTAAGTTPYHYVVEQRLQRARSMLSDTPHPISRIAVECGFKTSAHLSTKFRSRFGMSPSRFRIAMQRPLPNEGVERLAARSGR
jgi:AraC family transcriptional regulator